MFPQVDTYSSSYNVGLNKCPYNPDNVVENLVRFQVDYHFSDVNLSMDNYLLSRMHEDPEYWIPVKIIANLTKIRLLTENEKVVLEAIKKSNLLILNEDETKVKRRNFIPPKPKQHKNLRRTVFLYGLPSNMTREKVINMCSEYGTVKNVIFDELSSSSKSNNNIENKCVFGGFGGFESSHDNENLIDMNEDSDDLIEGPNREIAVVIMAKRLGSRMKNRFSYNNNKNNNLSCSSTSSNKNVSSQSPNSTSRFNFNSNNNCSDLSHLRSCFVVFDSQSQANKLVKSKARAQDGIRAMHQYDFIKSFKKIAAAKARGFSPLFSSGYVSNTSSSISSPSPSVSMNSGYSNQKNIDKNNANLQSPNTMAKNIVQQDQQSFVRLGNTRNTNTNTFIHCNNINNNPHTNINTNNNKNNNSGIVENNTLPSRFPKPLQSQSQSTYTRFGNNLQYPSQNKETFLSNNQNQLFVNGNNNHYNNYYNSSTELIPNRPNNAPVPNNLNHINQINDKKLLIQNIVLSVPLPSLDYFDEMLPIPPTPPPLSPSSDAEDELFLFYFPFQA